MKKYSVINLKTDPALKKRSAEVAAKLGVSLSAVLNNELRRFAVEQSVSFDLPEVPNAKTVRQLAASRRQIDAGHYHHFASSEDALVALGKELE